MLGKNSIMGAILGVTCSSTFAAHICWVDKVVATDGGVRVTMESGYQRAARSITRSDGERVSVVLNSDGSFKLQEGEAVLLSTIPEDSCTGKSVKQGDKMGLELEANHCQTGIGCQHVRESIVGE